MGIRSISTFGVQCISTLDTVEFEVNNIILLRKVNFPSRVAALHCLSLLLHHENAWNVVQGISKFLNRTPPLQVCILIFKTHPPPPHEKSWLCTWNLIFFGLLTNHRLIFEAITDQGSTILSPIMDHEKLTVCHPGHKQYFLKVHFIHLIYCNSTGFMNMNLHSHPYSI